MMARHAGLMLPLFSATATTSWGIGELPDIVPLVQWMGAAGFSRGGGDRTVIIAGNVGDTTAQATAQSMNRFLNRLPNITIREGHRVKVYLTSDLDLPAYVASGRGTDRPLLARSR